MLEKIVQNSHNGHLQKPIAPAVCRCEDCEAGVSPLAYLVDLLDYTTKRIVDGGQNALDLKSLIDMLHQPLGDLIISCDAVNTPTRQVRICIEVLRSVLGQTVVDDSDYRQAAYLALLDRLGVSYEELRLSHTASTDKRQDLADRLGIDLGGNRPDNLDALLFDLSKSAQPAQPAEKDLNDFFGLADTHVVMLSPPQADPAFVTWQKTHLRALWAAAPSAGGPVVDPDLIDIRDFRNPVNNDPAYALWQTRAALLKSKESDWRAQVGNQPGNIDALIQNVVAAPADLLVLAAQRDAGKDIRAQLATLNLDRAAFDRLMDLRAFIGSGATVLDSEWDEFYGILLEVWKRQQFTAWITEEANQKIFVSPDLFQVPVTSQTMSPEPTFVFKAWRGSLSARRSWQDLLSARISQDQATHDGLQAAVDATEEATLTKLRDALLLATDVADPGLEAKAHLFTAQYFIDAKMGACHKTTRVAQAIDTVQGLVFAVRNGELLGQSSLQIDPQYQPTFDEEWRWMGSYSTWRAAMLVFLYPENLPLPTLRPVECQTPVFAALLDQLRTNQNLTPLQACESAKQYSDYLRDVCSLAVQTSCLVSTPAPLGDCRHPSHVHGAQTLLYLFALASGGNVYFSTYQRDDTSGYAQSFWNPVPGLGTVDSIVGAVPYLPNASQRQILLFATVLQSGVKQLVFTPYDLLTQRWTENIFTLDLPGAEGDFTVAVDQRVADWELPPAVVICMKAPDRAKLFGGESIGGEIVFFMRYLNEKANGWTQQDFMPYLGEYKKSINSVKSLVSDEGYLDFLIFFQDTDGLKAMRTGRTKIYPLGGPSAEWIGAAHIGPWGSFSSVYAFVRDDAGKVTATWGFDSTSTTSYSVATTLGRMAVHCDATSPLTFQDYLDNGSLIAHQPTTGAPSLSVGKVGPAPGGQPSISDGIPIGPAVKAVPDVTEQVSEPDLQKRAGDLADIFSALQDDPPTNLIYFSEAYFFLPMLLALKCQQSDQYTAALDWFRTVYDYSAPAVNRLIYYGFVTEQSLASDFHRLADWLQDPLNPNRIAETRKGCYLRFTLISLVRCFLDYADAEFTRDTAESVERARLLYLTALDLLDVNQLRQAVNKCPNMIGTVELGVPDQYVNIANDINGDAETINDMAVYRDTAAKVQAVLGGNNLWNVRLEQAREIVAAAKAASSPPPTIGQLLEQRAGQLVQTDRYLLADPEIAKAVDYAADVAGQVFAQAVSAVSGHSVTQLETQLIDLPWLAGVGVGSESLLAVRVGGGQPSGNAGPGLIVAAIRQNGNAGAQVAHGTQKFVPGLSQQFCVPLNPVLLTLQAHAEVCLFNLRHCRNIAGLERQLDPYSAPTNVRSDLPSIGTGGTLLLPGAMSILPTPYRYSTLIERAKQLVAQAQQLETAYLSALEKRDAETYNLLKARQDLEVTRASIRLQDLRVIEASGGVDLALLQQQRQQDQVDHYTQLVSEGMSEWETDALALQVAGIVHLHAAAAIKEAATFGIGGIGDVGGALIATAAVMQVQASYDRRMQEWQFQQTIALDEARIGAQQTLIAEDQLRVAGQERQIAQLQSDHAQAVVDFLANKFTNAELYGWMSSVLRTVYRYFLQQATSMAQAAGNQLAFERQAPTPLFIQNDYWDVPAGPGSNAGSTSAPDRQGLTGSARLLADIYQLDQYSFETNKRKLQLSKTISLAQLAPAEFQRFRETGVMRFATPMQMFDREFPGHYLRLIRRIKTSVIALIPPTLGIRATLSTSGASRAVIGANFQTVTVRRESQLVALSSPQNATGVFDLDVQSDILLPFEGLGVDTDWEFRMPKAANFFDYTSIADVLVTVEYTAMDSPDYRIQLLQSPEFAAPLSTDRPFSFRFDLADQWYDLHNPDQTAKPMVVTFTTQAADFPPNIENLSIQQVVLYFARSEGSTFEVTAGLRFTPNNGGQTVGGAETSFDGVISTRRGNAPGWLPMQGKAPFGNWDLDLTGDKTVRDHLQNEEIEDILFVVTYYGHPPAWPA